MTVQSILRTTRVVCVSVRGACVVPAYQMTPSTLRSNPGVAAKLEQERMLKAGITAHKTGLPKKLLELFAPLPPLPHEVSTC